MAAEVDHFTESSHAKLDQPDTEPLVAESCGSPQETEWKRWCRVMGPGIIVMLADSDCGSIVTAAQSGAR